jgi:UDP-GlcNAc:undecaprenyl-phosphate GlcNAc-1-phosphate transferase
MVVVVAALGGQSLAIGLAGVVGGASLGFLIYNWHPATIYMGDTGSLFLGFTLSAAVLTLRFPVRPLAGAAAAVLLLLPALFDTALVVLSRFAAGRPVHVGGTDHTSHRLLRLGVPPACVVALLGSASFAGGGLGLAVGRGAIGLVPALATSLPALVAALVLLLRVPVYAVGDAPGWGPREVVGLETPELASNVP